MKLHICETELNPNVTISPSLLYEVPCHQPVQTTNIYTKFQHSSPLTGDSPNRSVPVPPASGEHDISAVSVQLMKKSGLSLRTHAGGHNWIATRLQFSLLLKAPLHDRMQK